MSKKNKNFTNEEPEVINMDDIGYMTDESIHERSSRLENERNRLIAAGRDPLLWEIEIAYFRREQSLRETRAQTHAKYLENFAYHHHDEFENQASASESVDSLN